MMLQLLQSRLEAMNPYIMLNLCQPMTLYPALTSIDLYYVVDIGLQKRA